MEWLRRLFRRKPKYIYGTAGSRNRPARKHRSGRVEFLMWKAGEYGHKSDYWISMNEYWYPTFKEHPMASARARERRAREEAEQQCHDWRRDRDEDDKPPPEPDSEPVPIHTTH